jgi:subtilisin family serine protease
MNNFRLICLIFTFSINNLVSQKAIYNQLIVKYSTLDFIRKEERKNIDFTVLSPELNIGLLNFDNPVSKDDLDLWRKKSGVQFVTYNYEAEIRKNPNDKYFSSQKAIPLTKINKVWELTTGGKTFDGKEIVVAIIDDGFDINHEDLIENKFVNKLEIPNDKKDNDGNGIIDDYNGFDIDELNGQIIKKNSHGTSVAGIIGAKSNNSIGVAGINWDVKLLYISGVNKLDEIIRANTYLLNMRKSYNSTNGAKGAFITTINYSGGIDNAFANVEPFKSWCDLYDLLGSEGVISVGSTDNENIDVAKVGDMPSTCTSEFLITVTNVDEKGFKVLDAGYGKNFIALGAPGENIPSTEIETYTNGFSGTSASAPMVAGVVALLYSLPCKEMSDLIRDKPSASATFIRNAIKNGVVKNNTLAQQTKWGGYLDAFSSLSNLAKLCSDKLILPSQIGDLNIVNVFKTENYYEVEYLTPDNTSNYTLRVTDILGRIIYSAPLKVSEFGPKVATLNLSKISNHITYFSIISDNQTASKGYYFVE